MALLTSPIKDTDDPSLTPPLVILDHAQVLREILLVYESSLGDDISLYDENRTPGKKEDEAARRREAAAEGCRSILDKMVDPAVEMCVVASETKQRLVPAWDREVFIVNVMTYLQVGCLFSVSFDDELTSFSRIECVRAVCLYGREARSHSKFGGGTNYAAHRGSCTCWFSVHRSSVTNTPGDSTRM